MSKVKSRLGRGLSSLISVSDLPVEAETPLAPGLPPERAVPQAGPSGSSVMDLDLGKIVPNPHQPRRSFSDASLDELTASMKSSGVIQPIIVRALGDGRYELVAGERRWRAAQRAGMGSIPAIVRDVDPAVQAQMALIENIQREDLNPIDRATAYRELIGRLGLTQSELASRLGEDRSSIANFLRLLDLPEPVRDHVRDGKLSMGHAKLLAGVSDPAEQIRLANLVLTQELSVRNLERLLSMPTTDLRPGKASSTASSSAHLVDLERTLARALGMRVQLKASAGKGKGRLTIHYSSLDQFDSLLARLGVTLE